MSALHSADPQSWIDTIRDALDCHDFPDSRMDEINTAMAWIAEALGLPTGADAVPTRHCDDCDFETKEQDVTVCPFFGCRGSVA